MFGIGKKKDTLSLLEFVEEMKTILEEFKGQDGANEFCRSKHSLKEWAWHLAGFIKERRKQSDSDEKIDG